MGKKKHSSRTSKRMAALSLAAIYLLCVLLGCLIIWLIPILRNREYLALLAENKGKEVLSLQTPSSHQLSGLEYRLYNQNGSLIHSEGKLLDNSEYAKVVSCLPELFEKGTVFKPARFAMESGHSFHAFGVIVGVVITPPSGREFASIVIRDFADIESSMLSYTALFTIVYAVAITFSIRLIRKERELNRMRRDLIANVSHELKTPITTIRAMAEVLYDGVEKDGRTRQRYSREILSEADRLEKLVLDILELSKLQSRHWEFKKEYIHADGLFPPSIDRYMMLCGDMGINMDISALALEQIPRLYTDAERITTLFSILMDNAVKFTGQGGSIWLTQELHPRHVVFCVRDSGPGIQKENLERVFDRFYKTDAAHNSGGSGLGLAIAAEIAAGLEEQLWVKSEYGKGAEFYFTIHF